MEPVSASTSSSSSTSPNNSVDLTPSSAQGKQSRVQFQARDVVLLLRELAAVEQPFVRGTTCWETIALNLMEDFPDRFSKITAHFLRERATNLMEAFLKADTKQQKQSGTEKDFKEKEELLESLKDRFAKEHMKQASLSAKHKEKEDRERGEKIREDAMLALKDKRTRQEDLPQKKKLKLDLEQILEERREHKSSQLKLREKELELREKELILEETKARYQEAIQQQSMDQMMRMQTMMQQQMEQMTSIISMLTKKKTE